MNVRAIIFDVYNTLLRVGPPPADADAQWDRLFEQTFHTRPPLSRLKFSIECGKAITTLHVAARQRGIPFPEINWPAVVAAVLPPFAQLSAREQEEFVFRQMQTGRTLRLFDGAGDVLLALNAASWLLGIISNAQAYTQRELTEHLAKSGAGLEIFDRELCLWSYQNGFSKPDPHSFQMLAARLEARGISPAQTLMVGDRLDNDIEPARKFGFQTWQLGGQSRDGLYSGSWPQLGEHLLLQK